MDPEKLKLVPLWVIAFLISGSFHEFSHAWTATKLGDPTPERMGRLTLNPIPHIDPMGLILIIIMTMYGFGIGWMKPVPVNPNNFRYPRRGMMLTSLSGPVSNLILAGFFILLYKVFPGLFVVSNPVSHLMTIFLLLNILLAIFNLLPIPPLDGGHIVGGLLPEKMAEQWDKIYPYGFFILLILLFTGKLGDIINPIIEWIFRIIR